MDTMTFVLRVVESAAWPTAIVVVALSLRRSLLGLLPRVKKVSYKGAKLEFEKQVKSLTAKAKGLQAPTIGKLQTAATKEHEAESPLKPTAKALPPTLRSEIHVDVVDASENIQNVILSGEDVINLAWAKLLEALRYVCQQQGSSARGVHTLVAHFEGNGRLTAREAELIWSLRSVQRQAKILGAATPRDTAMGYWRAAERLRRILLDRV